MAYSLLQHDNLTRSKSGIKCRSLIITSGMVSSCARKSIVEILVMTENTHLLCIENYHCKAGPLFDWLEFNRTSQSVVN